MSAAQSRSSVFMRREPSWALAALVSDGANSRSEPGKLELCRPGGVQGARGLEADDRPTLDTA